MTKKRQIVKTVEPSLDEQIKISRATFKYPEAYARGRNYALDPQDFPRPCFGDEERLAYDAGYDAHIANRGLFDPAQCFQDGCRWAEAGEERKPHADLAEDRSGWTQWLRGFDATQELLDAGLLEVRPFRSGLSTEPGFGTLRLIK